MNQSKIFLVGLLLLTSTTWAQPDEYLQDVEDSPTSMAALFDDAADTQPSTLIATTESVEESITTAQTEASVKAPTRARKAARGIASVPTYDCAGTALKINKGEKISKQEMAAYKKQCK